MNHPWHNRRRNDSTTWWDTRWEDVASRRAHPTHRVDEVWTRISAAISWRYLNTEVGVINRECRQDYEIVPLVSHEQLFCLWPREHAQRTPHQETFRPVIEFYRGVDGDELILQPSHHRKRWTDEQWVAFNDRRLELKEERKMSEGGALEIYLKRSVKKAAPPAPVQAFRFSGKTAEQGAIEHLNQLLKSARDEGLRAALEEELRQARERDDEDF